MKALLEAGVHFGHQTKRWNPKMAKYIFAARNDIHIIDLQISVDLVEEAYAFVKSQVYVLKPRNMSVAAGQRERLQLGEIHLVHAPRVAGHAL